MTTRAHRSLILLVLSTVASCRCGTSYVAPSSGPASAELRKAPWQELSLDTVRTRFDVNGDGTVDAADTRALQACIDAGADLEGSNCDLVPDGTIDQQDAYLLSILLGETVPRTQAQRAALATALRENASGTWDPALGEGSYDWNHDGLNDGADLQQLATLLEGDLTRFDLNGDGLLTLLDVSALSVQQARARYGSGPAASLDVDGDGTSSSVDIALLADLTQFSNLISIGLLDHDQNGRIDEADYCLVSEGPDPVNYFTLLLPAARAASAQAAAPPRVSICRADGRALVSSMTRLDTQWVTRIAPRNLYLEPVSQIPADYSPVDPAKATGRALFVLTTTPTERPLLFMALPWNTTLKNGNHVTLRVGGTPLPASPSLLLPRSIIPLDVGPTPRSLTPAPFADREAELQDFFSGGEAAALTELQENYTKAQTTFEALIAGCPCTLPAVQKEELVRYLLHSSNGLDETLAVTQANLEAAEIEQARLSRLYISAMNESIARHQLLADDIWAMELSKSCLLVAETGYDYLKGGPKEALKGLVSNALGELADQAKWVPDTETVAGDTAKNLGSNVVTGVISQVLADMVEAKVGKEGLSFKEDFAKRLKDSFSARNFTRDQMEGAIKTVIKMLPVYYLRFSQMQAAAAEARAREFAEQHQAALTRVGNLRAAVEAVSATAALIDDLSTRFFAKLAADGCTMTINTVDPCSFDLEAAIANAQATLKINDAKAAAALEAAFDGAGRDAAAQPCSNGPERRRLDDATVDGLSAAKELAQSARGGGTEEALITLTEKINAASGNQIAARDDFSAVCNLPIDANILGADLQKLIDAENAGKKALDDFEAAVKAALATYAACVQGRGEPQDPCSFDPALAETSPWASAAKVTGCLDTYPMNCCGDGKLQATEQCDLGSATFVCSGGQTCTTACQCTGGTALEPSLQDLLNFLGVPIDVTANFQPLNLTTVVHSASAVPAKSVANDHTTVRGIYSGTFMLDAAHIANLACGAGSPPVTFTACPPGALPLQPGLTHFVFDSLAAPIPTGDTGNIYQYGFPFDRDGMTSNNYTPSSAYPNDFFAGTDFWLELNRSSAGAWTLKASQVMSNTPSAASTRAHGFINGSAIGILWPASEATASKPSFRVSAFRHTGDYGINPPHNWDGSVSPAVSAGLKTLP